MNATLLTKEIGQLSDTLNEKTITKLMLTSLAAAVVIGVLLTVLDPEAAETAIYLLTR